MKIAVVSPGRSHLLDMSIMHIKNGHDVTFYTMVSKKRCEQFGFPADKVVSFFYICAPLMFIFRKIRLPRDGNRHLYYWIVRLADFLSALYLKKCDILIGLSGCALLSAKKAKSRYHALFFCDRGCRHILSQDDILNSIPSARQVYRKDIKIELEQYGMADYIILPSLHTKESFIQEGEKVEKLFVNPYGVNLEMFHPLPLESDGYDIIFVGNWSLQKGVDILVDACLKSGLSLLHVGAIVDFAFPEQNDRFHHIDPVNQPELIHFYSKAKILCLPSRQDGFGLVLFQAMVCGLPLVYSHYTGGPDLKKLVDDHEFLFEMPEYTVDSLSDTLLKALKKAEQQPRNSIRNYLTPNAVSNISWQAYGQRYNEFLLKIATEK